MRVAVLTIALLVAAPAFADVLVVDLFAAGDGLVTRDTDAELDWLDVTETRGLTYNDVKAGSGGWSEAGWRHATTAEVCGLFATLGGAPSPCPGQVYSSGAFGQPHLDLLGITDIREQPYGSGTLTLEQIWAVFDDGNAIPEVGRVELSVDTHTDGWVNTFIDVREDWQDPDAFTSFANFLVRPVPEPATALLLGAGLLSLAAIRRASVN